jgi:cytochrome c556
MSTRKWMLALAGIALLGTAGLAAGAAAQQMSPDELMKAREELMKGMSRNIGGIFMTVKGDDDDVAGIPAKATALSELAPKLIALFPPNTGHDAIPASRAKPEIWAEWAVFEAAANALVAESAKLAAAAQGGDMEAIRAQLGPTGEACGGCHEGPSKDGGKFRFPKEG